MARPIKPSDINDLIKAQRDAGQLSFTHNLSVQELFPGLVFPASSEKFGQVRSFQQYNQIRQSANLPKVSIGTYRSSLKNLREYGKDIGRWGVKAERTWERKAYRGRSELFATRYRGRMMKQIREESDSWYWGNKDKWREKFGHNMTKEEYYNHLIAQFVSYYDEYSKLSRITVGEGYENRIRKNAITPEMREQYNEQMRLEKMLEENG